MELSSEVGKRIQTEKTWCYLVQDGERTALMIFQNTIDGVAVVCGEGAISSLTLTLFQKDTLGSLIHLSREVACSPWGTSSHRHTEIYFGKSGFVLCGLTLLIEDHINHGNFIPPGRGFCKHS